MKSQVMKLAFAAIVLLVSTASADSILVLSPGNCGTGASCSTFTFTTTVHQVNSTTYDISFAISNAGSPTGTPAYLQSFGLTLFSGSVNGSAISSVPDISSTYNVVLQDNQEQANNGTGVCSNGSPAGHLCITVNKKTDATGYLINPGESISFNFTLTTGPNALLSTWEVKANGTDSPNQGGNVFALSNTGTPTTSQVPEPAGLALLGSGLLGFGGYFRSKFPL